MKNVKLYAEEIDEELYFEEIDEEEDEELYLIEFEEETEEEVKIENEVTVIERGDYFYFKASENMYWLCFCTDETESFFMADYFTEEEMFERIRELKSRKQNLEVELSSIDKELKSIK